MLCKVGPKRRNDGGEEAGQGRGHGARPQGRAERGAPLCPQGAQAQDRRQGTHQLLRTHRGGGPEEEEGVREGPREGLLSGVPQADSGGVPAAVARWPPQAARLRQDVAGLLLPCGEALDTARLRRVRKTLRAYLRGPGEPLREEVGRGCRGVHGPLRPHHDPDRPAERRQEAPDPLQPGPRRRRAQDARKGGEADALLRAARGVLPSGGREAGPLRGPLRARRVCWPQARRAPRAQVAGPHPPRRPPVVWQRAHPPQRRAHQGARPRAARDNQDEEAPHGAAIPRDRRGLEGSPPPPTRREAALRRRLGGPGSRLPQQEGRDHENRQPQVPALQAAAGGRRAAEREALRPPTQLLYPLGGVGRGPGTLAEDPRSHPYKDHRRRLRPPRRGLEKASDGTIRSPLQGAEGPVGGLRKRRLEATRWYRRWYLGQFRLKHRLEREMKPRNLQEKQRARSAGLEPATF